MASPTKHVERELKFSWPPGERGADGSLRLDRVKGVTRVDPGPVDDLPAVYFDTNDLRLAANHVTLRRRAGGDDAGWHLKVPVADDERIELRLPLTDELTVPEVLVHHVRSLTRGRHLVPVAELRTRREEHHLRDQRGTDLAVLSLDEVQARRLLPGLAGRVAWREAEIELVDGPAKVLDRVADHLTDTGAQPSPWWSKLQRALTDGRAEGPSAESSRSTVPRRGPTRGSAGDVLVGYLRGQHEALLRADVRVRARQPDGVHDIRVAARRLRASLATYRPFLVADEWESARAELQWIGRALGRVRDDDVFAARVTQELDELPATLVLGPVHARLAFEVREQRKDDLAALDAALDSDRYIELVDRLDALLADPPLTRAARKQPKALLARADHARRRVRRAAEFVARAGGPSERDRRLHDVRKAAKRARYAAELVEPVGGKPARRLAKRMEAVQDMLGDHNDSIDARNRLREHGVRAHLAKENGFTFGVLWGVERGNAERVREGADASIRAAIHPHLDS